MPNNNQSWTESDAYLAFDEVLSDRGLTPIRQQEIIRSIVALCMNSPQSFRRLWSYGRQSLLVGELARRAYDASRSHPQGLAFRSWLESLPTLEIKASPAHPFLLSRSQQAAWTALEETSALYFSGDLRNVRIKPRTARLIAGPSGIGKTHLVRTFAQEKGYGFLSLTYGEWIPKGARSEETTAISVLKLLAAHEHCLIVIDELDKIGGGLTQEWSVSIRNDLYSLLDRTWFHGSAEVKGVIQRRFQENLFLVGCGTWQDLWSVKGGAQAAIGFLRPQASPMPDQIRAARSIPTELLNRFHPEILLLEPMRAADFAEICAAEGMDVQAAELGLPVDFNEAEASGLGMRWLEALALKIHVARARRLTASGEALPGPSLT